MLISVQQADFDVADISRKLCESRHDIGAITTFTGKVRDKSTDQNLLALELEHYPGMTEKALTAIVEQALARWDIDDVGIVHRVGRLEPGANIVLVVAISAHRKDAFEACEFLMDYLKTQAPFWKKEITKNGEHWVEFKHSDQQASDRWQR